MLYFFYFFLLFYGSFRLQQPKERCFESVIHLIFKHAGRAAATFAGPTISRGQLRAGPGAAGRRPRGWPQAGPAAREPTGPDQVQPA